MADIVRRDGQGRFLGSGNPSGRPSASHWKRAIQEHYYELLRGEVSDEDWLAVVRKAIEQGREGSSVARKWLSAWLLPSQNTLEILLAEQSRSETIIRVVYGNKLENEQQPGEVIDYEP